jgi:hypothetical protein
VKFEIVELSRPRSIASALWACNVNAASDSASLGLSMTREGFNHVRKWR